MLYNSDSGNLPAPPSPISANVSRSSSAASISAQMAPSSSEVRCFILALAVTAEWRRRETATAQLPSFESSAFALASAFSLALWRCGGMLMTKGYKKEQVRQCWVFCTAIS